MAKYKCITCREEYVPLVSYSILGFCSKECWTIYRRFWRKSADRGDKVFSIEHFRDEVDAILRKERPTPSKPPR